MGIVYILKSLKNKKYYIGSTNDLTRRIAEHNSKSSHYTTSMKPFELVFSQEYPTELQARKIENKLKSFKSREIIEKIISDGFIKMI